MNRYAVYGDLAERDTVVLATTLAAKGLDFELFDETSTLSLSLAARTGTEAGPYLRTPEGFVLSGLHEMLDWLETSCPEPALLPDSPIRQTVARLLEDWLELWLPRWPRRSWATLERLGLHLRESGYLLGLEPCRPDWILAAWLESNVLIHDHAREHLLRHAPRLVSLGEGLLKVTAARGDGTGGGGDAAGSNSGVDHAGDHAADPPSSPLTAAGAGQGTDDVIPISLLSILEEIGGDYHGYLGLNRQACKEGVDRFFLDLGLGRSEILVSRVAERRRAEIGWRLSQLENVVRRDVRQVLEPVGLWHALTLPPVLDEVDPGDPRNL